MSLAHIFRNKPFQSPARLRPKDDEFEHLALRQRRPNADTKKTPVTPNVRFQGRSLEEWVLFEERHWQGSRAREAARRIRALQRESDDDLKLSGLRLHSVPPLTGCQSVTRFLLSGNCLQPTPDDVGDLPNLKILHIENSQLCDLPKFYRYSKLVLVSASGNPIRHIPPSLAKKGVAVLSLYTLADKEQRKEYFWIRQRRKVRSILNRFSPAMANLFLPLPDEFDSFPF